MSLGGLEVSVAVRDFDGSRVTLVRASGEVDLSNAEELAAPLLSADAWEGRPIVLDLADVPFMDSSGLRVLLSAVRDLGSRLAVVIRPESPIEHLLELAQLQGRVPAYATEQEAITAVVKAKPDGPL
jgi:anti-anti-sigma factor